MAKACVYLMNVDDKKYQTFLSKKTAPRLNIGIGEDQIIADVVGYTGELVFDKAKPDVGTRNH